MSSALFPEKFAMYFSTMNSLSAKIYSDIQAVEDSIKFSAKTLSYNEKCAVLDKCLIHDIIHKKNLEIDEQRTDLIDEDEDEKLENRELFTRVHFNDPCLDQDQTTSLLLSVYPKKPEKYVFEENGFWLDEHSQPFNYCKPSQTNYCKLGELVKGLPAEALHTLILEGKEDEKAALKRSQRESKKLNRKLSKDDIIESSSGNKVAEKKEVKKKAKAPSFFGVNVMGASGGSQQEQIRREPETRNDESVLTKQDPENNSDEESNLPKQKQNLELIAELQAKLNRNNKTNRAIPTAAPTPAVETTTVCSSPVTVNVSGTKVVKSIMKR